MKKIKGFTLIELLVVIAIIGILATIVIFNVASARDKANAAKALSEGNQVAKAVKACNAEGSDIRTYGNGTDYALAKNNPICSGGSTYPDVAIPSWNFTLAAGGYLVGSSSDKTLNCGQAGCSLADGGSGGGGGGSGKPILSGALNYTDTPGNNTHTFSWAAATGGPLGSPAYTVTCVFTNRESDAVGTTNGTSLSLTLTSSYEPDEANCTLTASGPGGTSTLSGPYLPVYF